MYHFPSFVARLGRIDENIPPCYLRATYRVIAKSRTPREEIGNLRCVARHVYTKAVALMKSE